ncbi:PucR family transcriptional regulator [Mycobacterium sp.]|uniref:PucR family transcriptional regulator n=1 Tax=Mycobacterium sp. TaxID=1785 RepID=UPI002CA6E293|nr:helix-turn-helix domain-containing protein [Mycobacterium sp.]HTQ17147.1 helix-turn-helix domain-containing protein [Mycobacterium sp.]
MSTQALARMAEAFNRTRDKFIATTLAELAHEVPALDDHSTRRLLTASATENVVLVVDVLSNGIDPNTVAPPGSAVAYAQRAAQHGIPLAAILRAYRFGQMRLLNACFAELPAMSAAETAATLIEAINVSNVLHDQLTEQIAVIYQEESARRARDEEAVRQQWITRLLNEPNPDVAQAESALGYRVTGKHVAVEAWTADAPEALSRLLPVLRRAVPAIEEVLVAAGELQQRVWLRVHTIGAIDTEQLDKKLNRTGLRLAIGRPGEGLDGFRAAAHTAARVKKLALSAPHSPRVVSFDDIAPVALLSDDPSALSAFVAATLGGLASTDPRCQLLRETMRIFLATNRSYADTANRMVFHRNTIYLRVQQATEQYGLRLDQDTLDVQLALAICHWYGDAVLREVT